jgi:hypothetical protein
MYLENVSNTVVQIDLGTSVAQVQYLVVQAIAWGTGLVTLAGLVAAVFKKQEGAIGKIQDVINLLALNFGYAKNAEPK